MGAEKQEENIQMFFLYLQSSMYFDDLVPEKQRETAEKRQESQVRGLGEKAARSEEEG